METFKLNIYDHEEKLISHDAVAEYRDLRDELEILIKQNKSFEVINRIHSINIYITNNQE